ncbi:MAG: phosphatidylglycerophosphatase A [Candidatus Aenigmatarchaeota archaeon]
MKSSLTLRDKFWLLVATIFGVGYFPIFSGTVASILGIVAFLLIKNQIYFSIFTFFCVLLSFPSSERAEKIFFKKDSKKIIIDDFVGMLLSLILIPNNPKFLVSAFFLFRLFDAIKIPPADKVELLNGAKGVVGDDIVAGLYTNFILQVLRVILKIFS